MSKEAILEDFDVRANIVFSAFCVPDELQHRRLLLEMLIVPLSLALTVAELLAAETPAPEQKRSVQAAGRLS